MIIYPDRHENDTCYMCHLHMLLFTHDMFGIKIEVRSVRYKKLSYILGCILVILHNFKHIEIHTFSLHPV